MPDVDKARVAELKKVLETKLQTMQEFSKKAIKVEGENVEVKSDDAIQYKKLQADCENIKGLIQAELYPGQVKSWMDGDVENSIAVAAGAAEGWQRMGGQVRGIQGKSLGELFVGSKEFKEFKAGGGYTMREPWELEAGNITLGRSFMEQKDLWNGQNPQVINQGLGTVVQFDPLVPRGHRPNRVRDLFPNANTSANLIDYFQVIGFAESGGDGAAAPVADYSGGVFGLKPHSNLTFNPAQAPVRTIAHWEAAHRNILNDTPQLQATINNELMYGLQLVEDFQLLNGDGNGENIKGILNTEGIQIYPAPGSSEIGSDTLRKAATLSMLANYPSTGYVLHPNDWEKIELQKGTTGSGGDGQYMLFTNIAIGAQSQVWRQPVVETPAMTQGTFLSGAFGTGAQVYDREQALIRIAEQHADFFVRNAVVILCEERLALAVKRPESFVKGTFNMP
jgi:hypothetical protein